MNVLIILLLLPNLINCKLIYDENYPSVIDDVATKLMDWNAFNPFYDVERTINEFGFTVNVQVRTILDMNTCYILSRVKSTVNGVVIDDWYERINNDVQFVDMRTTKDQQVPDPTTPNKPPWDSIGSGYYSSCGFTNTCIRWLNQHTAFRQCLEYEIDWQCYYKFGRAIKQYYRPAQTIHDAVVPNILARCTNYNPTKYVFGGWGYGGATVIATGMHLYEQHRETANDSNNIRILPGLYSGGAIQKRMTLVTFGTPKMLDAATAVLAEKVFMGDTHRVVYNGDDIVSSTPLSTEAVHVGRYVYNFPNITTASNPSIKSHYKYGLVYGVGCEKWAIH